MSQEPDYENMTDEELMNIAVPNDQPVEEVSPALEEEPVDEPMFVESGNTTLEDSADAEAAPAPETEEPFLQKKAMI